MSTPARRKAEKSVSEAIARPVRTGPQAVVAFAIVEFIDSFLADLTEKQYGAAVGLLVLILAGIQALVENKAGWGFFRKIPPLKVPVADTSSAETRYTSPGMEYHEDFPEDFVGDPVEPEHQLDVTSFVEVDEDNKEGNNQ